MSGAQGREDLPETARARREQGKSARIANAAAGSSRRKVAAKGGKSGAYQDMSKTDLMKRARQVGIKGRSSMSKGELISALGCDRAARVTLRCAPD